MSYFPIVYIFKGIDYWNIMIWGLFSPLWEHNPYHRKSELNCQFSRYFFFCIRTQLFVVKVTWISFKVDIMLKTCLFILSQLYPMDFPGAVLPQLPERCKVIELRLWLKCRGHLHFTYLFVIFIIFLISHESDNR